MADFYKQRDSICAYHLHEYAMKERNDILEGALRQHVREVRETLTQQPDWTSAAREFDTLFASMANPKDPLWSSETMEKLTRVYLEER